MNIARCILAAIGAVTATSAIAAGEKAPDTRALQRGEQVYARCVACHAIEANRTGPQHCGLFGRRAGTAPGFDTYSKAMRESTIVWNERSLDVFLEAPMQAVPGTSMGYAGVKSSGERADLIAWLREATRPGARCSVRR
ncbi:MAG: c-type cytochrome [Burkholderiaceae bacterium]|uniref:Cytochrome c n=1 Tax=Roseateles toxinivorans TaxID=270368 RepID=A0A4R6QHX1_9BURK|nr:c-type cytochrome [Roseateles toxinivorans]MBT9455059.1 c-type cytochrome [Burkholderiaceae bacterium]TDP62039.1 cytochrome c [Roseateles toxinivorans]